MKRGPFWVWGGHRWGSRRSYSEGLRGAGRPSVIYFLWFSVSDDEGVAFSDVIGGEAVELAQLLYHDAVLAGNALEGFAFLDFVDAGAGELRALGHFALDARIV
jgi:hypothetical protein